MDGMGGEGMGCNATAKVEQSRGCEVRARGPEALHYNSLYSYSNDTRWVRPADGGRAGQSVSWGGQESKERWAAERVKRVQHCSWVGPLPLC